MARSIDTINKAMVAQVQADAVLGPVLTSTSSVSLWGRMCYDVAVVQWTLENLQDQFKADVAALIAAMKPHTRQCYATMAQAFQYGFNLPADSDTYDNTNVSASALAASLVINYVAVVEVPAGLYIKIATLSGGDLAPVPTPQVTAFTAYMQLVKDAGVRLFISTGAADGLKLSIDIYYNALVLDGTGARNDGTNNTPVQTTAATYLKNLPFNGVFALQKLQDQLEGVDGVELINIKAASAQYGALPYTSFAAYYLPDSGYLRFLNPSDLTLNFIAYSE